MGQSTKDRRLIFLKWRGQQRTRRESSNGRQRKRTEARNEFAEGFAPAASTSAPTITAREVRMERDIQDEVFSFKQDLLGSRNYYSDLWGRFRVLLGLFYVLEAVSCVIIACSGVNLNAIWARAILLLGITISTFKYINVLPQRVKDLDWQYHECHDIVNCLEREQDVSFEFVSKLRERFAEIEKKDMPTIECLMATCRNKALLAMGVKQQFQLTWFEKHVGIYCPWVKYDDHAKLVDV